MKVIIEKKKINFGFKIKHKLYDNRDKYEKKFFFQNKNYLFKQVKSFQNVNSNKCSKYINNENPDIIICFGIGILKKNFSNFLNQKLLLICMVEILLNIGGSIHFFGLFIIMILPT